MQRRFLHRACQFVLIFYLAASLSPKYASLLDNSDGGSLFGGETEEKTLVHGIFWLNLVGSELLASIHQYTAAPDQAIGSESADDDLFLIKRKRAVYRERFTVVPLLATEELPVDPDDSAHAFLAEYSVPHDPIHCHADGYTALSTGLSPPALFA